MLDRLIPAEYRLLAALIGVAVLMGGAGWAGSTWTDRGWQSRWDKRQADIAEQRRIEAERNAVMSRRQGEAATYALQDLQRHLERRFAATLEREKRTDVYALTTAGRAVHDPEWVRLVDAAITGQLPAADGPGTSDAAAKEVTAAGSARILGRDFDICNDNAAQLTELQEYLRRAGVVVSN